MEDGTLSISGYGSKAVKADGTISFMGGVQNFDTTDITENALATGIESMKAEGVTDDGTVEYYDLQGRRSDCPKSGIMVIKSGKTTRKVVIR